VSINALERLAADTDSPMAIVTAATPDGRRSGCLVGFWTQCSIDPPRVLVCISVTNHTLGVAKDSPALAVHWLGEEDREVARLFGGETGDEIDKFERCAWQPGPGGAPVLDGVKGWIGGRVVERVEVGDHVAFVVEAESGAVRDRSADELGFQSVKDMEPGHQP
jgi:flavin reductase (DIM6/NTAB) family NADH-FMN oxidoreductase RutF